MLLFPSLRAQVRVGFFASKFKKSYEFNPGDTGEGFMLLTAIKMLQDNFFLSMKLYP